MATPPATASLPPGGAGALGDKSDQELIDMTTGYGGRPERGVGDVLKDVGQGMLSAGASGIANSAFSLPGMPADIDNMVADARSTVSNAFRRSQGMPLAPPTQPLMPGLPTGEESRNAINKALGTTPYEPRNPLESAVSTVGGMIPAVVGTGGFRAAVREGAGAVGKGLVQQALIPGLATETAGQAARLLSPENESLARGIAGTVTGTRGVNRTTPEVVAPTIKAIRDHASGLYNQANRVGLTVAQVPFARALDEIVAAGGLVEGLDSRAMAAANHILKAKGEAPTLQRIDDLRQVIGKAIDGAEGSDLTAALKMQRKLDEFVDGLENNPNAVISGNPREAVRILREARATWAMQAQAQIIDRAIRNAKNSSLGQSGRMGLALRSEFQKIAKKSDPDSFDFQQLFPPKVWKAIQAAAEANLTEKGIQVIARLSPEARPSLMALAGGGIAAAVGGNPAAIGLAVPTMVGQTAQNWINRKIKREAQKASGLSRGGKVPGHRLAAPLTVFQTGNMATMPPPGGGGGAGGF